jgi:hypothetical protein
VHIDVWKAENEFARLGRQAGKWDDQRSQIGTGHDVLLLGTRRHQDLEASRLRQCAAHGERYAGVQGGPQVGQRLVIGLAEQVDG